MIKAFCKPRIKVGTEWVTKGQNIEQATGATAGIARAVFDRIFKWLIEKCNDTLIDATLKKLTFVLCWTSPDSKYSNITALNRSPLTLSTRNSSSSLTITCSSLNKRSMLRRVLTG